MAVSAPAVEFPATRESGAREDSPLIAKAPVHLVLALLGVLWLVPTFGLFITSILPQSELASNGWWKIFSKPSVATWSNYDAMFHNHGLITALKTTAYIAVGNTLIVVVIGALAGYALAWLEFPGRDWIFIVVVALLVVPLQMALIPMFRLYNTFGLFDSMPGSCSSTLRSGCRSQSSCSETSLSGYRETFSSRPASTGHPNCGSSCG